MAVVPEITRLLPDFGVEIDGLDLSRHPTAAAVNVLDDALRGERLVIVRGQDLDEAGQLRLGARLGCLVADRPVHRFSRLAPEVHYESSSSGGTRSRLSFYNERWHADHSWTPEGAPVGLLYAVKAEPGCTSTGFADMVSAYASLPESMQSTIDTWVAIHNPERARRLRYGHRTRWRDRLIRLKGEFRALASFRSTESFPCRRPSEVKGPGAHHAVVQTDECSGRRYVRLGDHAATLAGFDEVDGLAQVDALNRCLVSGAHVYRHVWATGDLVVFDNRSVLHRREPDGDERAQRVLRRCLVWR